MRTPPVCGRGHTTVTETWGDQVAASHRPPDSPTTSISNIPLEARPEAEFRVQRHIFAATALDPRRIEIAVGQLRQVFGPIGRKREVPRQANVKVRIEGPKPVAPHFVVNAL